MASRASRGFNGFSRIPRIGSWGNPRKSDNPEKIREICVNPLNPCSMLLNSVLYGFKIYENPLSPKKSAKIR
ncbi:MAG: hypothetical protein FWG87_05965 [Defluviitaleaceae bacterium]|nr:hypothetical protein [Defluviitaleaceae bacterium]